MKTRLFSFLFVLIAGVGMVRASDTEVDGIWYDFDDNALTASVTYQGSSYSSYSNEYTGNVTIPKSVTYNSKTYSVTSIGEGAFSNCSRLTSVTIPNSVTSIGEQAFANCSGLTSVTIPNSVTSIGNWAFQSCNNLISITCEAESAPELGESVFLGVDMSIPLYVPSGSIAAYQAATGWSEFTNIQAIQDAPQQEIVNPVKIGDLYYNLDADNLTAEVTYQEQWSDNNYSGLTSANIPSSVTYNSQTYSVTSIGYAAFAGCSSLTSVTIPNSVTSIGDRAFDGCSSLPVEYNIRYADTYLVEAVDKSLSSYTIKEGTRFIGSAAFYECSLTSVDIPNSVTSIGESAFAFCNRLTSVTIPNSVTNIEHEAFSACISLTTVTIPNSVTSIVEYAFWGCSGLTSIIVESGNSMYDSRENCNAIIETSTNTLILGCQNTVIPNSVTSIGDDAFYNCSDLTSVTIPNSVTSIGSEAFWGCRGLTTISIPNSVTSIGGAAFDGCSGLTSITCEAESAPELGSNVFYNVDKSIPLYVPSGSIAAYQAASGWKEFTNIQAIQDAPQQEIVNPVKIGDLYYNLDADNLTAVVTYQKYESTDNYSGLTSANIPSSVTYGDKTFSVTSIVDAAFSDCSSLSSVIIGNSVTSIGNQAFYVCSSLTSVTIGNSVTSIESGAFAGCSSLTSVTIPNSVTRIGDNAFYTCKALTSVTIPESVTSIGISAFSGCSSLTSIIVENGNSMYDSRDNCNAIIETSTNTLIAGYQNTIIPNGVTSIGNRAFFGCSSLTSITIPNSVTSIREFAFTDCNGLTSVTIPNSVKSIGGSAFSRCSSLTSITCQAASAPELGTNAFYNVDKSIPLYVPSGSIAAYQAAEGWNEFTNIQAIPSSGGDTPMFPGDPGTITYKLQLGAAVIDGDSLPDYTPTGAGGYPQGSEVTVTAQDIPGYAFVQWSDSVTDQSRTVVVNESMTLTALYSHSMIEIAVAANRWTFICLPPLGDRQYTEEMFTYDGLTGVKWGTYSGTTRASGKSGWVTPETFNALQGYIIYSTTAGTLRINAYQDDIRQGQSSDNITTPINAYDSNLPENAGWNFLGNPYAEGFDIAGFAKAGIESPITVWNGTGYDTYTPGIDTYILQPFEAFFIQKAEGGAESITFSQEYLSGNGSNNGITDAYGALPGYFSISETDRVQFSRGNLQYVGTWQFAENQWDYFGDNQSDDHRDLFGWGTGDAPNKVSDDDNDYSTFVDWGTNAITNGGNTANRWHTLTKDEWVYLFYTRTNAATLFGLGSVNGVNGTILLPDNWVLPDGASFVASTTKGLADQGSYYFESNKSHFTDNTYTAEQWSVMESAGAVFLPAAAGRYGSYVSSIGAGGFYWSVTHGDTDDAYYLFSVSNQISPQENNSRHIGYSVRLVR